jgi:hypothetical protein
MRERDCSENIGVDNTKNASSRTGEDSVEYTDLSEDREK